jgi:hypothetical protein
MNKYLEKIASLNFDMNTQGRIKSAGMIVKKDVSLGKVKEPAPITAPGSKLIRGAKTLFTRALYKAAQDLTHKQELLNTGVIAGLGTATGFGAHKLMNSMPKVFGQGAKLHNAKIMALSGAAGLAADYAGVKLNKQINKHVQ